MPSEYADTFLTLHQYSSAFCSKLFLTIDTVSELLHKTLKPAMKGCKRRKKSRRVAYFDLPRCIYENFAIYLDCTRCEEFGSNSISKIQEFLSSLAEDHMAINKLVVKDWSSTC